MDRNTICILVSSSILHSSGIFSQERVLDLEEEKMVAKNLSWREAPYQKMKEQVQKVPKYAWWSAGALSVIALGSLGLYFYKRNSVKKPSWIPKGGLPEDITQETRIRKGRRCRSLSSPTKRTDFWGEDIADLRKELKLVKSAVIDLEEDAYGTTFLGDSPKLSVDGKDIFIVPKDK